jgi:hypothetical protein
MVGHANERVVERTRERARYCLKRACKERVTKNREREKS